MVAPSPQEWLAAKRLAAESAPKEAPSPQEWLAAKRLAAESKAPVSEWEDNTPVEGVKAYEPSTLNKVGKQYLENLYSGYNTLAGVRQGLVDPAIGVANLIAPKDKKLSNLVTGKEDKWEIPSLPLVNEKSGSYKLGRVGGQVAPVNVVMKGAGAVAKVLGASPELVAGITTQGIEGNKAVTGLGSLAANILKTGTLGAGGGVISQAVISPNSTKNEYLQSGAIGAGTTLGFNTLGAATRAVADLFSGGLSKSNARAIIEKVMGDKLAASKAELAPYATPAIEREAKWTTQAPTGVLNPVVGKFNDLNAQIPQTGALTTNLTTGQLLHGISDPKVASLEEMARITNGQPFVNKDIAQRQDWVNANKYVSPNLEPAIAQEAHFNAAREAELNALQGVKERDLTNRFSQFEASTAKETPQFGIGENIAERRNQLLRQAKQPFTNNIAPENLGPPLIGEYSKLFTKYPEKFSLQGVFRNANEIVNELKSQLDTSLVKPVITKASKLFGGFEADLIHGTKPKQGSLSEMHDLLSTIKATIRDAGDNRAAVRNLSELQSSVEGAINKGLSKDALKEYNALSSEYRTKVAEPYYEGVNLDIARNKTTNKAALIAPENVVSKYLTESGAKEFNRGFGNDPEAIRSLSSGIEQQLMNSANPEKFIADNRHALNTLGFEADLTKMAEQLRSYGAEKTVLEAGRKAIPETVVAESEAAASRANQARLLKEGIETALPNVNVGDLNKIDREAYLNFMRKEGGNIESKLTGIGQQKQLNQMRSDMLRDQEMKVLAKANREPVKKIVEGESITQRLPSLINKYFAFGNQVIGKTEGKIIGATGREVAKAMADPEYAVKLFSHLPADQRMAFLKVLRQSGPSLARAAVASTNQQ
jgi:hypothetical protein